MGPQHLVQWTRIAYGKDVPADLHGIDLSSVSSDDSAPRSPAPAAPAAGREPPGFSRDDLRQLILEELRSLNGAGK